MKQFLAENSYTHFDKITSLSSPSESDSVYKLAFKLTQDQIHGQKLDKIITEVVKADK